MVIPPNLWQAHWIWYPGMQRKPNFYFYARKSFDLEGEAREAWLHISAYTDYRLYINGAYVGRGPNPSLPAYQYYDTHDICKYLRPGKNVIAVLAHNYAVGLHWHPMGPGGLIARAEIKCGGRIKTIATDGSWRIRAADCYDIRSPRMMWSCQYQETFHFSEYDPLWSMADYDDRVWTNPQVLGRPPVYPWDRLIPREIPFLQEERRHPVSIEKGRFVVQGFHAVSFREIEEEGKNRLYYAVTHFHSDVERKAALYVSCDDAFKIFLNGQAVHEQSYNEEFVREQQWVGMEDYEQVHNGVGPRREVTPVLLKQGWNKIVVAVDQGPEGWGFSLGFVDGDPGDIGRWTALNFDRFVDLEFSSAPGERDGRWELHGPFESSGLKNSLDLVVDDAMPTGGRQVLYNPQDYLAITDYDLLMRSEVRRAFSTVPQGAPIVLNEGECLVIDMGKVLAGCPVLEVETDGEAVLDIGCGNVLSEAKNLCYMFQIRCVDRLYLEKGVQAWEAITRREGRYLHISCRKGQGIRLKSIAVNSIGYPVQEIGSFASADELLGRIWEASKHNTRLIMQDSFQDCLRRECGLHNSRSMLHAFPAAFHTYGDTRLIRKTILEELRTQDQTGWMCGEGPTDNGWDEPTKAMWTVELTKLYYLYSGDRSLLDEVYERLRCFLRFYSRLENKDILIDGRNEYRDMRGRCVYIDDQLIRPPYIKSFDTVLFGYNIIYYGVLNCMAYIAQALGRTEDAQFYSRRAGYVKKACNEVFWDRERDMYIDWVKEGDQSNECPNEILILALYYGICDEERERKVLAHLFDEKSGTLRDFEQYVFTFGFYYFILELMFRYGLEQRAYDLLRKFYGGWLSLGMTTMGEHFTLKEAKGKTSLGREYGVHGYGTSAHAHFYTNILGVRPLEPGFSRVLFAPHPGDLTWAKGGVPTPLGEIHVAWEVVGSTFVLDVEIPQACTYEIKLPGTYQDYCLKVNGEEVRNGLC